MNIKAVMPTTTNARTEASNLAPEPVKRDGLGPVVDVIWIGGEPDTDGDEAGTTAVEAGAWAGKTGA